MRSSKTDKKTAAQDVGGERVPVEYGKAEVLRGAETGVIISCGTQLVDCVAAADRLRRDGIEVGVVNARFVRPIDKDVMTRCLTECGFVVTVEENALVGGFGSALLEFASDNGLSSTHVRRLGIPDRFVEHGERAELLADLGIDSDGIVRTCREIAGQRQETA